MRYEDRLILPLDVPGASSALNRYLVRVPGWQRLSLYRIYVLRERGDRRRRRTRRASASAWSCRRATRRATSQAAIERTPVMGSGTELIFVEGGSTDGTWDDDPVVHRRATAGRCKLRAYQQTGKGKGDAVRLGFAKATGDLLMILDADLTVPPEDLPEFFDVAARGQADFVQGTRLVYPMEPGAMRFFNKLGNVAFSQLFTLSAAAADQGHAVRHQGAVARATTSASPPRARTSATSIRSATSI